MKNATEILQPHSTLPILYFCRLTIEPVPCRCKHKILLSSKQTQLFSIQIF